MRFITSVQVFHILLSILFPYFSLVKFSLLPPVLIVLAYFSRSILPLFLRVKGTEHPSESSSSASDTPDCLCSFINMEAAR